MIRPPGSVYFAALFSRFETICSRRVGSPSIRNGSGGRLIDQLVAERFDQGKGRLDGMGDDRVEVDGLLAKLDPSARDPRDVEKVFEEPGHVLDLAPRDVERFFDHRDFRAPGGG